ncbi:hypothetical protein [Rhizobium sp. Root1220]|nr:hypothetical protein [Rhizobium sp. Root1220]
MVSSIVNEESNWYGALLFHRWAQKVNEASAGGSMVAKGWFD